MNGELQPVGEKGIVGVVRGEKLEMDDREEIEEGTCDKLRI